MSQQVQELIDKIKTEGIETADQKSREIEDTAKAQAKKIVDEAQGQARQIIAEANAEAQKTQASTQIALKQSSRDTLLALRKSIESVLKKVIAKEVSDSLSTDKLAGILEAVIGSSIENQSGENDVLATINAKDLDQMGNGFLAKLQKKVKGSIKLQANDGITKGFTISFDQGKSCFDFSDESLAEYLGGYLNTQVAQLLKEDN